MRFSSLENEFSDLNGGRKLLAFEWLAHQKEVTIENLPEGTRISVPDKGIVIFAKRREGQGPESSLLDFLTAAMLQDNRRQRVAEYILILERWENDTLTELHARIHSTAGRIYSEHPAYHLARKNELITEGGEPYDLPALRAATAAEVDRRTASGTFV